MGVVTIFLSTYMILYSYPLYEFLSSPLKIFERQNPYREAAIDTLSETGKADVILVGLGTYGSGLAEYLLRRKLALLGVDFDPQALDKWRKKNVLVIYGYMADPEMYEHLPLNQAQWVISAVRSEELNLVLLNNLKWHGYEGNMALTAANEEEARKYEHSGAHLIFRPFIDAAEQAADTLAYAIAFLPKGIDWPISFLEVRIRSGSHVAGMTIKELPLSAEGVSILAVSRGGHVHYEPDPDFMIFPSDILLLAGPPAGLKEAENLLNQLEVQKTAEDADRFDIAEIKVAEDSDLAGKSLAELHFRQRFGATLIGIRRDREQITTIKPAERVQKNDCLIVVGKHGAVKTLQEQAPL